MSWTGDEPCVRMFIDLGETSRWGSEERAECWRQRAPESERGSSPFGRCCCSSLGTLCPGEWCEHPSDALAPYPASVDKALQGHNN